MFYMQQEHQMDDDDNDKDCNGDDSCDENCNWEEMSYWALILRDGFDDVVMMSHH